MESEAMMRLTQISTARLRLVALNAELAELATAWAFSMR